MAKTVFGLAILCIIPCIFSCRKETVQPNPVNPPSNVDTARHIIELGRVAVMRDSNAWIVNWNATINPLRPESFYLNTKNYPAPGLSESLSFSDIPLKTGKYEIEIQKNSNEGNLIPSVSMGWVLDGDQVLGGLSTDTTKVDNYFEVIHYDSLAQTVEGRFEVFLINHWASTNSSIYPLPDSLALTQGKFYLKLK